MTTRRFSARATLLVLVTASTSGLEQNPVDLQYQWEHHFGTGYGEAPTQLRHPSFITHQASTGNVVVSDTWNHRLQVFSSSGHLLRVVGSFGVGMGEFYHPHGLVFDNWSLFVVDASNHRVQRLRAATFEPVSTVGSYGSGPGKLSFPRGIVLFGGTLYVADMNNHRISMFNTLGMTFKGSFATRGIGRGELSHPEGLAFAEADAASTGELFVADSGNDRIVVFDQDGNFLRTFGTEGEEPGQFLMPVGVAVAHGRLYVSEYYGARLQTFTMDGKLMQSLNVRGSRFGGVSVSFRNRHAVYAIDEDWAIIHVLRVRGGGVEGRILSTLATFTVGKTPTTSGLGHIMAKKGGAAPPSPPAESLMVRMTTASYHQNPEIGPMRERPKMEAHAHAWWAIITSPRFASLVRRANVETLLRITPHTSVFNSSWGLDAGCQYFLRREGVRFNPGYGGSGDSGSDHILEDSIGEWCSMLRFLSQCYAQRQRVVSCIWMEDDVLLDKKAIERLEYISSKPLTSPIKQFDVHVNIYASKTANLLLKHVQKHRISKSVGITTKSLHLYHQGQLGRMMEGFNHVKSLSNVRSNLLTTSSPPQ